MEENDVKELRLVLVIRASSKAKTVEIQRLYAIYTVIHKAQNAVRVVQRCCCRHSRECWDRGLKFLRFWCLETAALKLQHVARSVIAPGETWGSGLSSLVGDSPHPGTAGVILPSYVVLVQN